MRIRQIALPLALLVVGIVLLIGCIPVPATRQFQPDWKLRPETAVGIGPDKPVQLGQTRIEDAFVELSKRSGAAIYSYGFGGSMRSGINPPWSIMNWFVSTDRRQFALAYQVRTATDVYPLCFFAQQRTEQRWLTLDVDWRGVVTGASTSAQQPADVTHVAPDEWLLVFDETQRQKLQAAGFLPPDDILRQAAEAQRQMQQEQHRQIQRPQAPGQRYPTNAPARRSSGNE